MPRFRIQVFTKHTSQKYPALRAALLKDGTNKQRCKNSTSQLGEANDLILHCSYEKLMMLLTQQTQCSNGILTVGIIMIKLSKMILKGLWLIVLFNLT